MTNWNSVIECQNVNDAYEQFLEKNTNSLNSRCLKQGENKRMAKRKQHPWMTTGLQNACKKNNLLYRNFIKNRNETKESRYKRYKNKLTKILKRCEREYFSNLLKDYKHDAKKIWKVLNNVMNKKGQTAAKSQIFCKSR